MSIEQYTEALTLSEMKCKIGQNQFGFVFPQGDINQIDKIKSLLDKAGGKPRECSLDDYTKGGNGKAKPEFIITFNDEINTIIVVECKNSVKKHCSNDLNFPNGYAIDGVLYYAKFLKENYNVIAVAVSGTKKENIKVNTFYWAQNQQTYNELIKARDIILEPVNYLKLIKGERLQKEYSIEDIRETALDMHETLRQIKVSERHKPIFIAGILIALENKDFANQYANFTSFDTVITNLNRAIQVTLENSDIKKDKVDNIKNAFNIIGSNEKLKEIPLGHKNSITWYIEQLEIKIKPMMNYADSTLDSLGVFYHEFIKYSGGDGKGLGIVLTPQHLTEFMCKIADVNKNSKVVDICCGSGSFLVSAMSKMFKQANPEEIKRIKSEGLYGVELDVELFTLAIANMIIRKDGKSNIYHGDCFNKEIVRELKEKNINIGLINPPYAQEDICELEFVENMLEILTTGGVGVAVVPMSCAIGTKFKEVRERLFKHHTLKAVFSMPDEIFYPTGTNVCVMVWEAHKTHNTETETFFGYYKDDGFAKRKKLGRIDVYNKWEDIKKKWLKLYKNRDVEVGLSTRKCVNWDDEWLCEAYMETDYSKLKQEDLQKNINDYLAYLIKNKREETELDRIIETDNWRYFNLIEYFDMKAGKYYSADEFDNGKVPLISASDQNNGVMAFTDLSPKFDSNCLTIGKVGITTFYQEEPFCASPDVTVLIPKEKFNKYIGIFIKTIIERDKYKWSYGRQIRLKDCQKLRIKLPSKNNKPDWNFMENHIRSLQNSDKI